MTRLVRSAASAAVALTLATAARAAEKLPDWVPAPDPAYRPEAADVPAVVLLREREVLVDRNGGTETRERVAMQCLTTACGEHAVVRVPYLRGTQSVTELRVVLASPGQAARGLGRKDVVDASSDPDDLYDESRVALLSARRDVVPGTIVASEWVRRDAHPFPQDLVDLQDRLPVLKVRCSVVLPEGWSVEAVTLNRPALEARVAGPRTTWEAAGLTYRPDEPLAPSVDSATPSLALTIRPPSGREGAMPAFRTWDDVGRWSSTLLEPAAAPEETVTAHMRQLTATAVTPRERFEAAARFVQELTYVSIQLDLARGGGYRPRAAAETLRRRYGDCKDKVTLLRGLLRAAGIATRPVLVSARDPGSIRRELPALFWFDHVILAVAGLETREGEPVVDLPGAGPHLLFDPTDPSTPPGQLPEALWGGLGLATASDASALVTLPSGRARLARRVSVEVAADGTFKGRLVETGSGSSSEGLLRLARRATPDGSRAIEEWIARSLPGARLESVELGRGPEGPTVELRLSGRLPGWQDTGKLAVLRTVLVPWRGLPALSSPTRRSPVVFRPRSFTAEYRLRLPASLSVSELPPAVRVERPFGLYTMKTEELEGAVVVTQDLQLTGGTVPAERFAEARDFVRSVLSSSDAQAVLKRSW